MASWPTTPEPPVRFTTLKGCFNSFSSSVAMMRAVASVPPPAPHGTMSCTGRCGYCACAPAAATNNSAAMTVLMGSPPRSDEGILTMRGSRIFSFGGRMNAPAQAGLASLSLKDSKLFREQCYIDGAWGDAEGGKTIAVHNPATGAVLGTVPRMGTAEAERAVEAAERALPAWSAK